MTRRASLALLSTLVLAWLPLVCSAAPTISNLSLRGLTIGQPTTVVIDGSDLLPDPKLVLPVKIASQTVKPSATASRVEIEITIDAGVSPGIYSLRLASGKGISSAVAVGIDKLPQQPFSPQISSLPVALHGSLAGPQVLQTKFQGTKGATVVLDCEAQRLGSNLKPIVRLYNDRGTQLAWSPPKNAIGDDARCELMLPADGTYMIELHDQLYRAGMPAYFRLKIGALQFADIAYPLGVTAGAKTPLKFIGGNVATGVELDATHFTAPGDHSSPLPAGDGLTGGAPKVIVSDFPELVETPPAAGQLQALPKPPVGISGVLSAANEEDKYLLEVQPGQNLRFDVLAHRAGSPLDGVLSIRKEDGAQLAANDDRPNSKDPLADFKVPDGVTKLQIAISDMQKRGGSDYVYRIGVLDLGRPDFELSVNSGAISLPAGATQVIPVEIERRAYGGAIELSVEGLPAGAKVENNVVPPGATIALLSITAPAGSPLASIGRIVGKALESPVPVVRVARSEDAVGGKYQPQLLDEIGLATSEPAPIGIVWQPASDDALPLSGKLPAKVNITRAEGVTGNVRLRLVSSQPMPQKKAEQPQQPRRRRGRQVPMQTVDDPDRALRLEGMPTFGADQNEPTVNVLVPGDLAKQEWDVALVAELLSADNKNVVATIATPVRRLTAIAPFAVELVGEPKVDGRAGLGETGKFTGKVVRRPGYTAPLTVTLSGLPKELPPPLTVVPADKSDFELKVVFPFGSKPGEIANLKLVAVTDANKADAARSNEIAVAVNVVPGEKPPAEQPKEIFDEDEKFVALLTEGGGQATIESSQKSTGKVSLKVTPDQKFNAALPTLNVKIRENPGPGEFRYFRFAWKKQGGEQICLQINHDGTFGPGGAGREGAKFRYHSGPNEVYGASLAVGDKLPAEFVVVTRDLFADFGEFTFTGIAFSAVDGEFALFDQVYLGRQMEDFTLIKP
ncbi:MAG TPA: hypothetical protein VMP01_13925 [Pirellulaceae bacterium]|nr:hypothetical protein [Pirellulaceae bacterium]